MAGLINLPGGGGYGANGAGTKTTSMATPKPTDNNPYQGGFNLNPTSSISGTQNGQYTIGGRATYNTSQSADPDEQALQSLTNEDAAARAGQNDGVSFADNAALENMYRGRLGQKNSLAQQIAGLPGQERTQENVLLGQAGQSLGQGLKNTRQNFNSRGLLYSGMREGGEQQTRQGVAGNLDSSISGSRRDSANALTSAQNAYSSVDLAQAQQSMQLANQAFDTASANNIARLQAMQQLGQGVGAAAGSYFGNSGTPSNMGPSGPSNYNTSVTGNYYDSPAMQQGLVQRTA